MTTATIAAADVPRPHRRRWVTRILFLLSVPIALIAGAAWFGANFLWVLFGPTVIFVAWGACIAVVLWRRRSRFSRALGGIVVGAILVLVIAATSISPAWMGPSRDLVAAADGLGTYLHFALHRRAYERQVAAMSGSPKLALFSRGGWLNFSEDIVYDDSDEILLDPEARSASWRARASTTELRCNVSILQQLGRHFYVAWIAC